MTRQTYADNVDANGKVFKTVGDNIREGARAGELIDFSTITDKLDALEPEISALQADVVENEKGIKKNSDDISALNEDIVELSEEAWEQSDNVTYHDGFRYDSLMDLTEGANFEAYEIKCKENQKWNLYGNGIGDSTTTRLFFVDANDAVISTLEDYVQTNYHTSVTTPPKCVKIRYTQIKASNIDSTQLYAYLITKKYKHYKDGYIYHISKVPSSMEIDGNKNDNTAYLILPDSYKSYGTPTKLCILCHGSTNGISETNTDNWTNNDGYKNLIYQLTSHGYAVIDSNGYNDANYVEGHEHWGCEQALNGYRKAYEYFTDIYNLEKEVYMYGFSMGGLTALNIACNNILPIKTIMIGCPVISLYDQAKDNAYMLKAYGIEAYDGGKMKGYDRYLDIINYGSTDYVFQNIPPIMIIYGTTDTNVSNDNIIKYANALKNSNKACVLKSYVGGHEVCSGYAEQQMIDMVNYFMRY